MSEPLGPPSDGLGGRQLFGGSQSAGSGPRSRASRERRRDLARVRAFAILLLLIGGGALAVWLTVRTDDRKHAAAPVPHACGSSAAPVAATIHIRVLNATNHAGLAASVAAQLRVRGYTVIGVGNEAQAVPGPAELRYGPRGVATAGKVLAVVPGAARRPDHRAGADVDLVLGNRFSRLAPAAVRPPSPSPSGCPSPVTPTPSPPRA